MILQDPNNIRRLSVIAATAIALACGSNYVYSAWAPQFAQRLRLNSTQSNIIGTMGNFGMYACGIPFGMLVDRRGPRWGVALGAILLGAGYYPIAQAYDAGPGAYGMVSLSIFSLMTGAGSASAFTAAIKVAALNYPDSRGTATAFPLSAFGLSAFFFSTISAFAMPNDTYKFLLLLATGTFILPVVSFFFLHVVPSTSYSHLQGDERLHRTSYSSDEPRDAGAHNDFVTPSAIPKDGSDPADEEEISSLLSRSSSPDLESSKLPAIGQPHYHDVRGFALLPLTEFWQLFAMLGLLTGIGLMTINNIGNNTRALWTAFDAPTDPPTDSFIQKRQSLHVSILSFASFTGRLLSGIGSDLLVSRLKRSRFWCLLVSATIFSVAQILGTQVSDPHYLFLVSSTTGLAYGFLFGVYPSLVAHAFGVDGLSQNWGTMTLAPVIAGNIFNLLYGRIYDSHSDAKDATGHMICTLGVGCYSAAYWFTFASALGGILLVGWSIWHENQVHLTRSKEDGSSNARHARQTNHERDC